MLEAVLATALATTIGLGAVSGVVHDAEAATRVVCSVGEQRRAAIQATESIWIEAAHDDGLRIETAPQCR